MTRVVCFNLRFYLKDTCTAFWFIIRVGFSIVCLGGDGASCHSSAGRENVPPSPPAHHKARVGARGRPVTRCGRQRLAGPEPLAAAFPGPRVASPTGLPERGPWHPQGALQFCFVLRRFQQQTLFSGFPLRTGALVGAGLGATDPASRGGMGGPVVLCPESAVPGRVVNTPLCVARG